MGARPRLHLVTPYDDIVRRTTGRHVTWPFPTEKQMQNDDMTDLRKKKNKFVCSIWTDSI